MKFRILTVVAILAAAGLGVLFFSGNSAAQYPTPVVDQTANRTIAQGELAGYQHHRNAAHVWKAIPFAAPPVGDLRWRAPRPAAGWDGVRESLAEAPWCTQIRGRLDDGSTADAIPLGQMMGQEDCLYLNIYAPVMAAGDAPAAKLPVMMWIHGGSNIWGRAEQYDPSAFVAKENVIVAVVQYRMGPLGWFAHDALEDSALTDDDKSANFANLDHIAALDWLAANIGAFGGDAANITIFGESAGGHNVATLLGSARAKGKFHKAIIQSGSFASVSLADAKSDGPNAAEAVARNMLGDKVTAEALRAAPIEDVYAMGFGSDLHVKDWQPPRIIADGIVVAKEGLAAAFESQETFNAVPIMTGTNRDETKLFNILDDEMTNWQLGMIPEARDPDFYDAVSEYQSRMWRVNAVDRPAQLMTAAGHDDIYAYRFDWDEAGTAFGADFAQLFGAAHSLEIPFLFGQFSFLGDADKWIFTEENEPGRLELSAAMMGYWAEFARNGKPGKGGANDLPQWQAWSNVAQTPNILILDSKADGGVRFIASQENIASVANALFADKRNKTPETACRVYQATMSWNPTLAEHNKLGC